jgi:sortase A
MAATVTETEPEVAPPHESAPAPPRLRSVRLTWPRMSDGPPGRGGQRRAVPPPREPRKPAEQMTVATVVAVSMMLVSAVLALFGAYLFGGSLLAQHRQQDVAFVQMKKDLALATVPVGGVIPRGTPVGILTLPRLGVEQVFEMGSSSEETLDGPGLRPDTVLPGQAGVSVIIGRRAAGAAPFRHLDQMEPGDKIEVVTGQGTFTYVVDVVRTSDAPAVQIPVVDSRLTLVTSDPAVLDQRTLQVSAALEGKALPASTGLAGGNVATTNDQAGAGGGENAISLLLWAQALLALVIVTTWAVLKMRWRVVWIGALPTLLAVLWHVFENLTVLLPNTL